MNWFDQGYAWFYQTFLFPLFEIRVPQEGKIKPYWKELLKTQYLSREELRNLQLTRLQQLLSFAYRESEYYHEVMERVGFHPGKITDVTDLQQLPTIDKQIIREELERISTRAFRQRRVKYNTGGSTGVPMQFYLPAGVEKSWAAAAAFRGYGWWGYRPGLPIAYFWSSPIDTQRETNWKQRFYRFFAREHYYDAYRIHESLLLEMVAFLRHKPGAFLKGYPSSLTILAKFILERDLTVPPPGAVFTTGETLFPEQRKLMEEAFGTPVADFYGNRETNTIIFQCPESGLYHVNDENVIVEVEPLRSQPDSGLGELIITDLVNYATPFIRYRTGDLVQLPRSECPCGRGLQSVEKIVGRMNQVLQLKNGRMIIPSIFPHFFKDFPSVEKFRIIQENAGQVRIQLVVNDIWQATHEKQIIATLGRFLGEEIDLNVELVDEIPPLKSGKISYVVVKKQ